MKLYLFNPNDYGNEYSVMAESKEQALEYLKSYLKNKGEGENAKYRYDKDRYELWRHATIENLPNNEDVEYTIYEYVKGQVIETFNG